MRLQSWGSYPGRAWRRFIRLELREDCALSLDVDTWHYRATLHGPQTWPWWRLLVVRAPRCNRDLPPNPHAASWNIWFYTRWGAWCWSFAIDRRTPAQRGLV